MSSLKKILYFDIAVGFDVLGKVPSESTFCRFLEKLSNSESLEQIFHDLVIKAKELDIIDGEHISIDSLNWILYTNPNWGMKKDTNGNNIRWFGWKLHILCDSKSELPLDLLISPASNYDGTMGFAFDKAIL